MRNENVQEWDCIRIRMNSRMNTKVRTHEKENKLRMSDNELVSEWKWMRMKTHQKWNVIKQKKNPSEWKGIRWKGFWTLEFNEKNVNEWKCRRMRKNKNNVDQHQLKWMNKKQKK